MKQNVTFIFILFLTVLSDAAFAKDLTHRFGVGIKNNTSENLPSLAATYFPSSDIAFTAGVGTDTKKDNSKFQMSAGIRKMIFSEPNLNFYSGAQLGLADYEDPLLGRESGAELLAVLSRFRKCEFYFRGGDGCGLIKRRAISHSCR
jgi:hypothetical protein